VVLDPHLRIPPGCRLMHRADGQRPVLVALPEAFVGVGGEEERAERALRRRALEEVGGGGVRIIDVPAASADSDRMAWREIVGAVTERLGVGSLMVEGGAHVLRGILGEARACCAERRSVRFAAVVTVAPQWLASDKRVRPPALALDDVRWWSVGKDVVLAAPLA
jgi:riboflavin biosynthesis pyrimidine reductase